MARPEIPVLYQDDHLLIVDKPSRLLVVPAPGRRGGTVTDAISAQLGIRTFPVHRLDELVTGTLVLAKTQPAKTALEQIFRDHDIERVYLALLSNAPQPPAGVIESRLHEGKDGVVRSVTRGPGQHAITRFTTLRRAGRHTLVECQLETGRRNQIRVHMADLGCPIVGDRKYGFRTRSGQSYPRPLLHAEMVAFAHPLTGAGIRVATPAGEPELHREA